MTDTLKNFLDFIRTQGVVGLAIAVVLGGAVGKVVSSLVNDIIMPLVSLLLGSTKGLEGLSIMGVKYGMFISSLVDFAIIAAVIYFAVEMIGLNKLDKAK